MGNLRSIAVLFGLAIFASTSMAQQPSREQLARARRHMEEGQSLYLSGRNLEAAEEFIAAFDAHPSPAFLYNAGISYERHGAAARAIRFYERYYAEAESAADRDEVRTRIRNLERQLADARPDVAEASEPSANGSDPVEPNGGTEPPDPAEPNVGEPNAGEPNGSEPNEPNAGEPNAGEPNAGETPEPSEPRGQDTIVAAGPQRAMKSLLSVETEPAGARVIVRRGGSVIADEISPFYEALDEGTYTVAVEHPDFETIETELAIAPGRVYVALMRMSQGEFSGMLRVVSDPPGADVYVDDRSIGSPGATPFTGIFGVGTHRVWVERPGFQPVEREVEVALGDQENIEINLERLSVGRLRVTANVRGAEVLLDGERVGTVPYDGEHPAGEHTLTVRADDRKDYDVELTLERGQMTPVEARLRPSESRSGAWVTATMGVLAVGGGVALNLLARQTRDELREDSEAGRLASGDDRVLRGRILSAGSYAAFGTGALLGILSIYYFARDTLPDSEGNVLETRDWSAGAMITPAGAELGVGGSF